MRVVRVRATGRVQGVAFRAWTQDEAEALDLSGWVRNASDGSVEALLGGPEERVAEMLRRMRRGPPAARVDGVTAEETDELAPEGRFDIWRTA